MRTIYKGPSSQLLSRDCQRRSELYIRAAKGARLTITERFPNGLRLAILIASLALVIWLYSLKLDPNIFRINVIYFFFVVYGFMFGLTVIFTMVKQNLGAARLSMRQRERSKPATHKGGQVISFNDRSATASG